MKKTLHNWLLNRKLQGGLTVMLMFVAQGASSQTGIPPEPLARLLESAQPGSQAATPSISAEPPRAAIDADGFARFIGAPVGQHFRPTSITPGEPHSTARSFLLEHASVFATPSIRADFTHAKTKKANNRDYVRLQQTYAGIPVFSALVTVQVDAQYGVECVLSHLERDMKQLDAKNFPIVPTLSADQAAVRAREFFVEQAPSSELDTTPPQLVIFAPSVFDEPGEVRLVWDLVVTGPENSLVNNRVLVDAHSGQKVRQSALHYDALNRRIYDANGTTSVPATASRIEGGPATGIADVDNAYTFLEDTYNFYRDQHGRDGIDGKGLRMDAVVRMCQSSQCPWANAQWTGTRMEFGTGWAVDDITAHELTHGVTSYESQLEYANDSGAINEAFSDIWGEFVDLSNTSGTDTEATRWLIGEDLTVGTRRNMRNPPAITRAFNGCGVSVTTFPDRLGSPNYFPPTNDPQQCNDYGGVHFNSSIINKLCFLLTDGDTFNGQTIQGMGIGNVANLFYEVNVNLLTSAGNYYDLFMTLRQAAVNLGWSPAQRDNVYRACLAVQIGGVYVDKSAPCSTPIGIIRCRTNGRGPFKQLADGVNGTAVGEALFLRAGTYGERPTFNKPMTISSYDGPATIGR